VFVADPDLCEVMTLEMFVQQTLVAIVKGVETGRATAPGIAPVLAPPRESDDLKGLIFTQEGGTLQPVFMVEFDVAVSVEGKKASGVGGEIRVLEFSSADGKRSSETHNATVSRIKFKIPVRLSHAAGDFRPW
jgi:hypothetical protein